MSDMGVNLSNIEFYTEATGTEIDDQAFERVLDRVMAAVPGDATRQEVEEAIAAARAANPDGSMAEIMETAVNTVNTHHGETSEAADIAAMKGAWDAFMADSGLTDENIGAIIASPVEFARSDEAPSEVTLKNMLAMFYLMMIEMAGEESANQLLESCEFRDEIKQIAMEKADELRTKGWISFGAGALASGIQVAGGVAGMRSANKGIDAAKAGDTSLAQALGGKSNAEGALFGAAARGTDAVKDVITGHSDAKIAELDGESQNTQALKDISDRRRQKLGEMITHFINMMQSESQTSYQTMTTIGRI